MCGHFLHNLSYIRTSVNWVLWPAVVPAMGNAVHAAPFITMYGLLIMIITSAEHSGAVEASVLNVERDGGILFSWKVNLQRPTLHEPSKTFRMHNRRVMSYLHVWFGTKQQVYQFNCKSHVHSCCCSTTISEVFYLAVPPSFPWSRLSSTAFRAAPLIPVLVVTEAVESEKFNKLSDVIVMLNNSSSH